MQDFVSILTSLGYKLFDNGEYYRTSAVYRRGDGENSLSISKKTGWVKDWPQDCSFPFSQLLAYHGYGGHVPEFETYEEVEPLFDEHFFDWRELQNYEPSYEYFQSRGISEQTLRFFQCFKAPDEPKLGGKMTGRICFPIIDEHGRLVGISGRTLEASLIKWKHLGKSAQFAYPIWLRNEYGTAVVAREIKKTKQVIVVESIGDALSLFDAGIKNIAVSFGLKIHARLICTFIRLGVEKIIVGLNNDSGEVNRGGTAAIKQRNRLLEFWDESSVEIKLPPPGCDFNDLNREQILEWKKSQ